MHTLLLLRHGKAVNADPEGDHARALNPLGRWQASTLFGLLARSGLTPNLAVISDARRTRETAELALAGTSTVVRVDAGLYAATVEAILDSIQAVPDTVGCLLVVGHNPGMGDVARLIERSGEPQAAIALQDGFPTAALAVFELDRPEWRSVGAASATLTRFIVPDRSLADV